MPIDSLKDFLIACVGASASFIGLLFVALSVVLTRNESSTELEFKDRRLAETSFTALADVFFVSISALISTTNIGVIALIAAFFGLVNVRRLYSRLTEIKKSEKKSDWRKNLYWITASTGIYIVQGFYAIKIMTEPANISNYYAMMGIFVALFGVALVRTWELTGIRSK
jgi:hypothetical protein